MMNKFNKLAIFLSEPLSSYASKGEITPRYFNPGNLFKEVHIVLFNDDKPDISIIQETVGDAKLHIHNIFIPPNLYLKTLGFRPFLLKKWANDTLNLMKKINPQLIRCHGIYLNAFFATEIKKKLDIPFILSLHGNPDIDYQRGRLARNFKDWLSGQLIKKLESYCLTNADHVIAVYSPIIPYLEKHKVKEYSLIYNVVALNALRKKKFKKLNNKRLNLLCVGRQTVQQKDPKNIIKALANLENAHLTLVGNGDLHDKLKNIAKENNCYDKVTFYESLPNNKVLSLMFNSDIYIYHSINYEISKSCLEASLIGIPVIANNRGENPAKELVEAGFILVKDSPKGYLNAIKELVDKPEKLKNTIEFSNKHANENWGPEKSEQKLVNLYKRYIRNSLAVFVPEPLSSYASKGEITPRYFNPGNLFKEVHIVLFNDDKPDISIIQETVGDAKLHIHNIFIPPNLYLQTLGFRPFLLKKWANNTVNLMKKINPQLIRCHGADLNLVAAAFVKKKLGTPYIVSLHINFIENILKNAESLKQLIQYISFLSFKKFALKNANLVLPVYKSIIPYLKTLGIKNYKLAYNVLNSTFISGKTNYSLNKKIKLISVGRQFSQKNPENIIFAIKDRPNVFLTLIGDGILNTHLKNIVNKLGLNKRVNFISSVPNKKLCSLLKKHDIFIVHCEYWELSKSVLEAFLTGLPIIINKRLGKPIPELEDIEICEFVDNSKEGYARGIEKLINNNEYRKKIAQSGKIFAKKYWHPKKTENKYISLYKEIMK